MNRRPALRVEPTPVESFFFGAMLLVVLLEEVCVCWLTAPAATSLRSGEPSALGVEWTTSAPPRYWIAGALVVLLYRVGGMSLQRGCWGLSEGQQNRCAFRRLWAWTAGLGLIQMAVLYLDRVGLGVR